MLLLKKVYIRINTWIQWIDLMKQSYHALKSFIVVCKWNILVRMSRNMLENHGKYLI